MIDTYILHLQNHLSYCHLEKMLDKEFMCPIIIKKKKKIKIKAMWHDFSSYATLTRP